MENIAYLNWKVVTLDVTHPIKQTKSLLNMYFTILLQFEDTLLQLAVCLTYVQKFSKARLPYQGGLQEGKLKFSKYNNYNYN